MEIRLGIESVLWWFLALLLEELMRSTGWAPSLTGIKSQRCCCGGDRAVEDSCSHREAASIAPTGRNAVWLTGSLTVPLAALVLALFLTGPNKHVFPALLSTVAHWQSSSVSRPTGSIRFC